MNILFLLLGSIPNASTTPLFSPPYKFSSCSQGPSLVPMVQLSFYPYGDSILFLGSILSSTNTHLFTPSKEILFLLLRSIPDAYGTPFFSPIVEIIFLFSKSIFGVNGTSSPRKSVFGLLVELPPHTLLKVHLRCPLWHSSFLPNVTYSLYYHQNPTHDASHDTYITLLYDVMPIMGVILLTLNFSEDSLSYPLNSTIDTQTSLHKHQDISSSYRDTLSLCLMYFQEPNLQAYT